MVKIHRKLLILSTKITVSQNIKIANIWKMIFHSFQHILYLSCKFDHLWKKKHFYMNLSMSERCCLPHPPPSLRLWTPHALGLRTVVSLVSVNGIFQSFACRRSRASKSKRSGQIYMEVVECAEPNEKSIFRYLRFLVFEIRSFLCSKLAFFD